VLKVTNLSVEVAGKQILKNVNLEIPRGEVHVLFGPNGSGKSSLISTILGLARFKVTRGKITFKGKDITHTPINERAKLGIGIAFQNPPAIRGVKLRDVLQAYSTGNGLVGLTRRLNVPMEFLGRDLNLGFSGGEMKRSEVLQVIAQNPDFLMLDEPDSGVDVENLEIIGKAANDFLRHKSGLLITHMGHILRYVEADRAHVMLNGRIACSGSPKETLELILKRGYKECEKCLGRRKKQP